MSEQDKEIPDMHRISISSDSVAFGCNSEYDFLSMSNPWIEFLPPFAFQIDPQLYSGSNCF